MANSRTATAMVTKKGSKRQPSKKKASAKKKVAKKASKKKASAKKRAPKKVSKKKTSAKKRVAKKASAKKQVAKKVSKKKKTSVKKQAVKQPTAKKHSKKRKLAAKKSAAKTKATARKPTSPKKRSAQTKTSVRGGWIERPTHETRAKTLKATSASTGHGSGSGAVRLRVELIHLEPTIWRELWVDTSFSLAQLHGVLQIAMGWEDCHLYTFFDRASNFMASGLSSGQLGEQLGGMLGEEKAAHEICVAEVLDRKGARLSYEYDMGDGWLHQISVLECAAQCPGGMPVECVAGARACPPEDCGGPPGYMNLLEAISNRRHPEHKDLLEWVGGAFDPAEFDLQETREELHLEYGQ